jgi:hypothetical protein
MRITDQVGARIPTENSGSDSSIAPKGGDGSIEIAAFTIPSKSTQVCRWMELQIGAVTLTAPSSPFRCVAVRP